MNTQRDSADSTLLDAGGKAKFPTALLLQRQDALRRLRWRRGIDAAFHFACIAVTSGSILLLFVLLGTIAVMGWEHLDLDFLTSPPSPDPAEAGILPPMLGTVWICTICGLVAVPLGIAAAVLLEEYAPRGRTWRRIHGFIQLNIANLAGVPSVVYGILALTAFVQMFGLFGSESRPALELGVSYFDQLVSEGGQVLLVPVDGRDSPMTQVQPGLRAYDAVGELIEVQVIGAQDPLPGDTTLRDRTLRAGSEVGRISAKAWYYLRLPLGRGVLAGGLTLMLVVLPILIIASQEALRAVPRSLREGALGLGATRWQTVWKIVLPAAVPSLMTGSILAMSRAIGEAAPLLIIAGIVYIAHPPDHLMDDFTALPLQIFNWAQRPQEAFHEIAASGILVLLVILVLFNALAVLLRHRTQRPLT